MEEYEIDSIIKNELLIFKKSMVTTHKINLQHRPGYINGKFYFTIENGRKENIDKYIDTYKWFCLNILTPIFLEYGYLVKLDFKCELLYMHSTDFVVFDCIIEFLEIIKLQ